MKLELENKLVEKYPAMFVNYRGDLRETCMAFGFECGDGWYDILNKLCGLISFKIEWFRSVMPDAKLNLIVDQVKEKYGTLRFYYSFQYEYESLTDSQRTRIDAWMSEIAGMVQMAEEMSSITCESCGTKSELEPAPFPRSECDACATIRADERASRDFT